MPSAPPGDGRITLLDALRGFALLGVFAMNIEWFNRPMQALGAGVEPGTRGLDLVAAWLVHVLVDGKFWTLFSLLFGMGFVVLCARIEAAGHRVGWIFGRRMLALLGFGVLHIALLWPGDILHTYAIAGAGLLALRVLAPRQQLAMGLLLYGGLAGLFVCSAGLLCALPDDGSAGIAAGTAGQAQQAAAVYATGGFAAVTGQRLTDYLDVMAAGQVMMVPMALGVFLVGSWLMSAGRMQAPAAHRRFWWRLLAWSLPTGLVCTVGSVVAGTRFELGLADPLALLAQALMLCGALPLALSYMALLVLAWCHRPGAKVLAVFAPAGRMALTHYLGQSLICSLLFYGYGAGLYAQWGRATQLALVLGVFALQMLASHLWLAHVRYGPLEWLWRWLTWGRRPAWRIRAID